MMVDEIRLKKIKIGKKKRKINLKTPRKNPDSFKYKIEKRLESMTTLETGIKSSNERVRRTSW